MLHELGLDVTELPSIHLSEQRRLLEGRLGLTKMENHRKMAETPGVDARKERLRRNSNKRARQRMLE